MRLTWTAYNDRIFGPALRLDGLPCANASGFARSHGKRYMAHAYIGGRYLAHTAGTRAAAVKRLEREINRRSIGLLGVDDVEFILADSANRC